jgi:hypothetical protein
MDEHDVDETEVILDAESIRIFLIEYTSLTGEHLWSWRRGDDTWYPAFVTRHDAILYMDELLRPPALTRRQRRDHRHYRSRHTRHPKRPWNAGTSDAVD